MGQKLGSEIVGECAVGRKRIEYLHLSVILLTRTSVFVFSEPLQRIPLCHVCVRSLFLRKACFPKGKTEESRKRKHF